MDTEIDKLLEEYRAINNEEKEGDLTEVANKIRERQAYLIENEGHSGLGTVD